MRACVPDSTSAQTDYQAYDQSAYSQSSAAAYDYSIPHQYQYQQPAPAPAAAPEPAAPQEPLPESMSPDPPSKVIHFRNVTSEITQVRCVQSIRRR